MKLTLTISCFFILALISCKKDNPEPIDPNDVSNTVQVDVCDTTWIENPTYDTIYSDPYLGGWPGSWWIYSDGGTGSSTEWAFTEYSIMSKVDNCVTITTHGAYLPRMSIVQPFHSIEGFVLGQNMMTPGTPSSAIHRYMGSPYEAWSIANYTTGSGTQTGYVNIDKTYFDHLDSLQVSESMFYDVACVERYHSIYFPHVGTGPHWRTNFYYARDVGLVRVIHGLQWGTPDTNDLVDYYIAPH